MHSIVKTTITGLIFTTMAGTLAFAGGYGYGGHGGYGGSYYGGYNSNHYGHGYYKKRYYKKRIVKKKRVILQEEEKVTKKVNQNNDTRGVKDIKKVEKTNNAKPVKVSKVEKKAAETTADKKVKVSKARNIAANTPKKPQLLTDEKGMTLYIFDKDKKGVSNCYEDCAISWPPYFAPEKAEVKQGFSIIARKDGKKQWAFEGKPLYYWAGDQKPGDTTGDGVGGVWHIVKL